MNERWKTIENYPKYEISNLGHYRNKKTKRIMKNTDNRNLKAIYINVCRDGKQYHISLARAVYQAFGIEELDKNRRVVHLDGDYRNNRIENLACKTYKESPEKSYRWRLIYSTGKEKLFYKLMDVQRSFPNSPKYHCNKEYVAKLASENNCVLMELNKGVVTFRDRKAAKRYREKVLEFTQYVEDKYGSMMNIDESDPKVIKYRKII